MYNSRIDQGGEKAFDPDWHEKSRARFQAVFTKVGEPLYGVDPLWECHRMLGGWSEHEIRLRHTRDEQWVEVTTALPENTRSTSDSNTLIEWISIRVGFLDEIAFPRSKMSTMFVQDSGSPRKVLVPDEDSHPVCRAGFGRNYDLAPVEEPEQSIPERHEANLNFFHCCSTVCRRQVEPGPKMPRTQRLAYSKSLGAWGSRGAGRMDHTQQSAPYTEE